MRWRGAIPDLSGHAALNAQGLSLLWIDSTDCYLGQSTFPLPGNLPTVAVCKLALSSKPLDACHTLPGSLSQDLPCVCMTVSSFRNAVGSNSRLHTLLLTLLCRCVLYTGHVSAGGSICLEALTTSGTPGSWQSSFTVEALLNVIMVNMIDTPVMYIQTPTGPGGKAWGQEGLHVDQCNQQWGKIATNALLLLLLLLADETHQYWGASKWYSYFPDVN